MAYREGGMAALPPRNRNTAQDGGAPSKPRRDDSLAMTVTWRRCTAGSGNWSLGNALVREVADAFAASKGRYGCRGIKAALRTGVSEKMIGRIMAEGGPVAHVPGRRRYGSYEGEATPAPGNLIARDFTAERPNEKRLTDITEIKAADGKVYLSPVIDCHDGKIVAYIAGYGPNAQPSDTMLEKAGHHVARGRASSDALWIGYNVLDSPMRDE